MSFAFMDRFVILKIHSPISTGNEKMGNKTTVEDSVYTKTGRRIPLMEQWKSKEILIWMNLVLYLEIKIF